MRDCGAFRFDGFRDGIPRVCPQPPRFSSSRSAGRPRLRASMSGPGAPSRRRDRPPWRRARPWRTYAGSCEACDAEPPPRPRRASTIRRSRGRRAPVTVSITGSFGQPLAQVDGASGWDRPIWSPDGSTILTQQDQVTEPDPTQPGRRRGRIVWDRFTAIRADGSGVTVVGPGAGACKMPGGRRPCEVRDPSWQPRR